MANVAIVGGSREVRLLIKGLLRLHHHQVVADGATFDTLGAIPAGSEPDVFVVDLDLGDEARLETVRAARQAHPNVRFVVLTPAGVSNGREAARSVGANAIVARPFAVRDLIEAVAPGGGAPPRSSHQP